MTVPKVIHNITKSPHRLTSNLATGHPIMSDSCSETITREVLKRVCRTLETTQVI